MWSRAGELGSYPENADRRPVDGVESRYNQDVGQTDLAAVSEAGRVLAQGTLGSTGACSMTRRSSSPDTMTIHREGMGFGVG